MTATIVIALLVLALLVSGGVIVALLRRPARVEIKQVPGPEVRVPYPVPGPEVRVPYAVPGPVREVAPPLGVIAVPVVVGGTTGGRPYEPVGITTGEAPVADSEVDGGIAEPLIIRAASVRGDLHRRRGEFRRDAFLVEPIKDGLPFAAVLAVVAAGNPNGAHSQIAAAAACRSVVTNLRRVTSAVGGAWQTGDVEALRPLLETVGNAVKERLRAEAQALGVRPRDLAVEITALLAESGDRDRRRYLAFGIGAGDVLAGTQSGWAGKLAATSPSTALSSDQPFGLRIAAFVAEPGGVVVLGTAAACAYVTSDDGKGFFAENWAQPGDLAEFLWQLSARTSGTEHDRTVVCVWDRVRR